MQLGQPNTSVGLPAPTPEPEPVAQAAPTDAGLPGAARVWLGAILVSLLPVIGPVLWVRRAYAAVRRAAAATEDMTAPRMPAILTGGSYVLGLALSYLAMVDRFPQYMPWMWVAAAVCFVPLLVQSFTVWTHLRNYAAASGVEGVASRTNQLALAPLMWLFPPVPILYGTWIIRSAGTAALKKAEPRSRENLDLGIAALAVSLLVFGVTFGAIMLPERVLGLGRDDSGSCVTIEAMPAARTVDEHVRVRNRCAEARTLTGWTIQYPDGERFRMGKTALEPGQDLRIFSGRGYNSVRNRHLAHGAMLLRGRTDGVRLLRANGNMHTSSAASEGMVADIVIPSWLQRVLD